MTAANHRPDKRDQRQTDCFMIKRYKENHQINKGRRTWLSFYEKLSGAPARINRFPSTARRKPTLYMISTNWHIVDTDFKDRPDEGQMTMNGSHYMTRGHVIASFLYPNMVSTVKNYFRHHGTACAWENTSAPNRSRRADTMPQPWQPSESGLGEILPKVHGSLPESHRRKAPGLPGLEDPIFLQRPDPALCSFQHIKTCHTWPILPQCVRDYLLRRPGRDRSSNLWDTCHFQATCLNTAPYCVDTLIAAIRRPGLSQRFGRPLSILVCHLQWRRRIPACFEARRPEGKVGA